MKHTIEEAEVYMRWLATNRHIDDEQKLYDIADLYILYDIKDCEYKEGE